MYMTYNIDHLVLTLYHLNETINVAYYIKLSNNVMYITHNIDNFDADPELL